MTYLITETELSVFSRSAFEFVIKQTMILSLYMRYHGRKTKWAKDNLESIEENKH